MSTDVDKFRYINRHEAAAASCKYPQEVEIVEEFSCESSLVCDCKAEADWYVAMQKVALTRKILKLSLEQSTYALLC